MGRATNLLSCQPSDIIISIHALRGEGDGEAVIQKFRKCEISIHALRGEGDAAGKAPIPADYNISIHALRGEGDTQAPRPLRAMYSFQSTPSVGRATRARRRVTLRTFHFNPRPPWGGRLRTFVAFESDIDFNPRPPWGGRRLFVYI